MRILLHRGFTLSAVIITHITTDSYNMESAYTNSVAESCLPKKALSKQVVEHNSSPLGAKVLHLKYMEDTCVKCSNTS